MDSIALIMAAGESKRIRSDIPKPMHPICGKALIRHVMDTVGTLCDTVVPILGHGRQYIVEAIGDIPYAIQDFSTGKGTGHAVLCASEYLKDRKGCVIVTAGDMPLVAEVSYRALQDAVLGGATAALLYADMDDPFGYGRVLIDDQGLVQGIVEQKDLAENQKHISACNASVYCFDIEALMWALPQLTNENAQGEYYLTDVIGLLVQTGRQVVSVRTQDQDECRGINTRVQLEEATQVMRTSINREHMLAGVTMLDAASTYVDAGVEIGKDTVLYPGVVIEAGSKLGAHCTLYPGCHIVNSTIGDGSVLRQATVIDSCLPENTEIGPFVCVKPE